ncbi:MAG: diguanylate cyclase [Acidobacteria bacterium]|nr:diguanylate cyclase [Acidobacteriota bacterium]MCA1627213.1 diguanylate cyclase [Acidobacteriota bacterium]
MEPKANILVVDDNPDKLSLLEAALCLAGYRVTTATDGDEALAAIESYQPDLVITDVMMPRMNGYELAQRIRANPITKFIPVIMQTAASRRVEDLRRASEVGALGYITDPTDLDLLLARTRTLLEFKAYLDVCEEAAFTDHLTGLANRRRFERQLEREVGRTMRFGHPFTLLMLDIDNFKNLNDSFGHDAGDDAIRAISKVLREGTRGIDLAARIGGEEFAVLLVETNQQGGIEVAERLRLAIRALELRSGGQITASFGVAECPTDAQTAADISKAADVALYEAKGRGRDQVVTGAGMKSNSIVGGDVQGDGNLGFASRGRHG